MDWSALQREGFALAAAAHGDRAAMQAARGLSPAAADQALQLARRIADLDREPRRTWVRQLLAGRDPVPAQQPDHPPRALGLLSPYVDRAVGRRWLELSPLPRPGYAAEPRLIAVLRQLATQPLQPKD